MITSDDGYERSLSDPNAHVERLEAELEKQDELLRRALPFVDHVSHHADARQWLADYEAMIGSTTNGDNCSGQKQETTK